MEITKPERIVRTWTVFCVFLLVYFLNALWYLCVYSASSGSTPYGGSYGPVASGPSSDLWGPHHLPSPEHPAPQRDNLSFLGDTWRRTRLVDLHDFRFVLNAEDTCGSVPLDAAGGATVGETDGVGELPVFALVFVHSAPAHFERRRAIRDTWGSYSSASGGGGNETVRVVFMLGEVPSVSLQSSVEAESQLNGDVIQGNFLDSYRNLTYKHVMGLKWVSHYCRQARFVFKVDDDVFVDVFQTLSVLRSRYGGLESPTPPPPRNLIMCFYYPRSFVKRSHRSKWHVAVSEYGEDYYPPYCAGWGIVMSTDLVLNLYRHSTQIPYFWIDDVVVSGILVKRIGARHMALEHRVPLDAAVLDAWVASDDPARQQLPPYTFGVPDLGVDTVYALWNKTLRHYGVLRKVAVAT